MNPYSSLSLFTGDWFICNDPDNSDMYFNANNVNFNGECVKI